MSVDNCQLLLLKNSFNFYFYFYFGNIVLNNKVFEYDGDKEILSLLKTLNY